jgi:2'-5' RNA ligase
MKYIIHCLLRGPVEKYHYDLVNNICQNFGLNITKEENLATHFTLKYWFETENIREIEKMAQIFCKTHRKTPVRVGGFGSFQPKVIFINVDLSNDARNIFLEFISELRKVRWMPWDKYDAENMHFHSTIAEECNDKCDEVWKFVQGKEKYFDCWFDNITILKLISGNQNSGKWGIHKTFLMK